MILGLFLNFPWLRNTLAQAGLLSLYAECLKISARGFFFAYAVVLIVSLPLRGLEFILRWVDGIFAKTSVGEWAIALVSISVAPMGLLIGVTVFDCLIVGVKARNQFLFGSLFSSTGHDERFQKLLKKIGETKN